jgi:hypothetical protein
MGIQKAKSIDKTSQQQHNHSLHRCATTPNMAFKTHTALTIGGDDDGDGDEMLKDDGKRHSVRKVCFCLFLFTYLLLILVKTLSFLARLP